MSNKIYVIKSYQFGYNDECYYVLGTTIDSQYTDLDTAQKKYQQLEIQAARGKDNLSDEACFFDGEEGFSEKMDAFVLAKTGKKLLDEYGEPGSFPNSLSDKDVLTFIEMADMQSYQLVEFDAEPQFYAIWLPHSESYHMDGDPVGGPGYLIYNESQDDLLDEDELERLVYEWEDISIIGTLDEISDNPILLKEMIKNNVFINYDENKKQLNIREGGDKAYIELNPLLKKPFYEVKTLSLQQMKDIQDKEIEENGYY